MYKRIYIYIYIYIYTYIYTHALVRNPRNLEDIFSTKIALVPNPRIHSSAIAFLRIQKCILKNARILFSPKKIALVRTVALWRLAAAVFCVH